MLLLALVAKVPSCVLALLLLLLKRPSERKQTYSAESGIIGIRDSLLLNWHS